MQAVVCPYCPQRFESHAQAQEHQAASHAYMNRSVQLQPLKIGAVSELASDTAEALLEAFYFQDEREAHLIRENAIKAKSVASKAEERMVETYQREFPHIDSDLTRRAGESFIRALFLQDEIENWEYLEQLLPNGDLADVMLSDSTASYDESTANDPRWEVVEDHLLTVTRLIDIDPNYANKQTQFWRLHGQISEYWEEVAREAHTIKLRGMLPDGSDKVIETLAQYFVAGVQMHDDWGHQYMARDLNAITDLVSKYYQKVFDVRESGRVDIQSLKRTND